MKLTIKNIENLIGTTFHNDRFKLAAVYGEERNEYVFEFWDSVNNKYCDVYLNRTTDQKDKGRWMYKLFVENNGPHWVTADWFNMKNAMICLEDELLKYKI